MLPEQWFWSQVAYNKIDDVELDYEPIKKQISTKIYLVNTYLVITICDTLF